VLRLSETAGTTVDAILKVEPAPSSAAFLGERGRCSEPLPTAPDGSLRIHLNAYESVAVRLTVSRP
jgi:hypothetical protein